MNSLLKRYFLIFIGITLLFSNSVLARRVRSGFNLVRNLDEIDAWQLSKHVADELKLKKLTFFPFGFTLIIQNTDFFSYGKNYYNYESWADDEGVEFIRRGNLFFIDADKYAQLSSELKNSLGKNAILINNLKDNIITKFSEEAFYTLTTIVAMLNSKLFGKHIIDCGAGEGILALVASRLGAKFLDLIEIDEIKINKAKVNLELNGLRENRDFNLICEDLNNVDEVVNRIGKTGLEKVVISNIGTWPGSYPGVSNQTSMQLLSLVPQVNIFIAGGYNTLLNKRALRQDKKAIQNMGFKVQKDEAEFGILGKFIVWIAKK